jgi:hypothetical protein
MKEWIFVLAEKDKETLGSVRTLPALQAARNGATIWLRGIDVNTMVDIKIKQLPLVATYLLDHENRLFLQDTVTPQQLLPELNWIEISKFITVEAATSAMPGKTDERISIQLVPTQNAQQGEALITSITHLKQYAETAPLARLNAIKLAVDENGNTIITGTPLPPLPGREYWRNNGLLLPCGFDFELTITATLFAQSINAAGIYEIVFDTQGQWQKIIKENFVHGTRSAIRQTQLPQLV